MVWKISASCRLVNSSGLFCHWENLTTKGEVNINLEDRLAPFEYQKLAADYFLAETLFTSVINQPSV